MREQEAKPYPRHKVLVLSRTYPNNVLKGLGLWVKGLVDHCAKSCEQKVISPVPYAPPFPVSSHYSKFRQIVHQNHDKGVQVLYPRFLVGPGRSLYYTEAVSYYLAIQKLVHRLWQSFPFEVIHAHFTYPDGVVGAWLGHRYKVPVVITEHAPWLDNWMGKSAFIRWQAVWAARNSRFHIAVSRSVSDSIAHYTGDSDRIKIIPVGVDGSEFRTFPSEQPFDSNQILYVGFINYNKGIDVLLKAMPQLLKCFPETRLVLVGGSFYRDTRRQEGQLQRMAEELGLQDFVTFVGHKSPHEVARYMRESALLVLPSRAESFGAVLVEALACGTPVVATRCGGPEDIVTEEVGVLVSTENEHALAEGIAQVLRNRARYDGAQLRRYALERFSWQQVAGETVNLYRAAIGTS